MTDQPMRLQIEELDEESGRTRNFDIEYGQAEVRIGRDGACDIVLESPSASRKHCLLTQKADGWFVVDLGSTLGTFHNGVKLPPDEPRPLSHGDTLNCSTHQLRVNLVPLSDPTLHPDPHALSRLMEGLEKEEGSPPRIWLFPGAGGGSVVPGGAHPSVAPGSFPLAEEGTVLTVGRSAECDIRLEDPFRVVSAVHARFERNWAGVFLFDSSINGIYVNGQRVEGQTQIKDGDRITIASVGEEPQRPLLVFADAGNDVPPDPPRGGVPDVAKPPVAGRATAGSPGAPGPADPAPGLAAGVPGRSGGDEGGGSAALGSPGGDAPAAEVVREPGAGFFGAPGQEETAARGLFGEPGGRSGNSAVSAGAPTETPVRLPINWILIAVIVVSGLALATVLVWGLILLRR